MKPRGKHGYTIIEVLIVVALMAALTPMLSKLYLSITRLHTAQEAALDRVLLMTDLEHDFRAAAREASGIAPAAGPFTTADRTVVFRVADGYTVFTVDEARQPRRVTLRAADGGWVQRVNDYRVPKFRFRFRAESDGHSASFIARPENATNRQGQPNPRVQVLAALRSFGAPEAKR